MKTRLSKVEKQEFEYLIGVLSSVVNNTQPPLPYEGISWQSVIERAKFSGLGAMFANTALLLGDALNDETKKALIDIKNKELYLDTVLDFEIEKILKAFEKHKIKNAPVKGYFLKKEYPRSDFRSVSDFDILFNREQADEVKKAFSEIGYEFTHSDDNQYHFQKKPYVFIEMHATLVHDYESFYPYLYNQLDRTVERDGYDYSCQLTPEDHYLYLLIHSSNHLRKAGLGIRMVLDVYIYYQNHKDDFDVDYLNGCLQQYGLQKFEQRIRTVGESWFSNASPVIGFDDFETFILLSGRLGLVSSAAMIGSLRKISEGNKNGKHKTKLAYLLSCLFPSKASMAIHYPYLDKAPFLLPVSWCSMWFKRFFVEKNVNVKNGFKNRLGYTKDDVAYYMGILHDVGFDEVA